MKTLTAHLPMHFHRDISALKIRIPAMVITIRDILAALSAFIVSATVIGLSIWLSVLGADHLLAAGIWAAAMVFIALALDEGMSKSILSLSAALALFALAWLQFTVASGFVIVAAGLLSPWVACAVFRGLR